MASRSALLLLALVAAAAVAGFAHAQDDDEPTFAALVARKALVTEDGHVVEGRNFTVTYTIYNVGNTVAQDVRLKDDWAESSFEVIGSANQEWAKLAPGANVTASVQLVPRSAGNFQPGRADVEFEFYDNIEEATVSKVIKSSTFGSTQVLTAAEHELATTLFLRQWTTFGVLAAGPVFVPLILYFSTKKEFDELAVKKSS